MPAEIFEIFGFPLDDRTENAESFRKRAICPFMNSRCDGGGNREMANRPLADGSPLRAYFTVKENIVPSGVCSIKPSPNQQAWVVCPRRLLFLGNSKSNDNRFQNETVQMLFSKCGFKPGSKIGVWSEIKLTATAEVGGIEKRFDYTFDYILMPLGRRSLADLAEALKVTIVRLRGAIKSAGYNIVSERKQEKIEDYPIGPPVIVEIMTSSTSGGNKKKHSTITASFENAILGRPHIAPGINYRQVWARMVSQLIVKSEVGLKWGGKTFWVLQDLLVHYISSTTGLNVSAMISEIPSEVNIISLSYGPHQQGIVQELFDGKLLSGPISTAEQGLRPCFQDIVRAPMVPDISVLMKNLSTSRPVRIISIPN